jgi:predicted ATP-grasp superfamily ATP-dependent carboligase
LSGEEVFRLHGQHALEKPVLIVAWEEDASNLGVRTVDYLIEGLGCREFGEILPERFFPMAGVNVVDDVAQFPQSKFYISDERNLVIFRSNIPRIGWQGFLNAVLDVVGHDCGVKEIYTLGAMISSAAHTVPRMLISIVNQKEMKAELAPFNIMTGTDYENPPGQKPTLSSYLVWLARQRNIRGVNLWVPAPFYLVSLDDPRACKRLVYFFNSKFDLGVDFTELDEQIAQQNNKIAGLFERLPELEAFVRRLETGDGLDGEESEKLTREMSEALKKNPF